MGFTPLVAIATSDARRNEELEWEHDLHSGYAGEPIVGDPASNYTIGVLDTGASVDLIGAAAGEQFGVVGPYMTTNTAELQGATGEVSVPISQPIGIFAQGLSAIDEDGQLDSSQLLGHSNVSAIVLPVDSPPTDQLIPTVVGIPMLGSYTSVIRNDLRRSVVFQGEEVTSPDVRLYEIGDPDVPQYSHSIPFTIAGLGGLPATTAAYYSLDPSGEDFKTPTVPTVMTAIPGLFPTPSLPMAKLNVGHGELGPTNPVQQLDVLLDTGAQASIISREVAANLNLDLRNPDFVQDVLGIGGVREDVPGFFVDYVRINASGGALEFSHAPFLVIDLGSPAGGVLDGVLGMNLFWNRNVVFEPGELGVGFFHVSEPLFGPEVLPGDVDLNLTLDARDIDDLLAKRGGPLETADPAVYDLDGDNLVNQSDVDYLVGTILDTVPGDTNLDGTVDLDDFGALKAGFGQPDGWAAGDFDGSGAVDLADFGQLKENFGFARPAGAAPVPEPAAWGLACSALACWLLCRRRAIARRDRARTLTRHARQAARAG